jgi:hypothetical protein
MYIELFSLLIKVVQTGSARGKYVVRLKADHIMQETAELVDLTFHLDIGARVLLKEAVMLLNLSLQLI